MRHSSNLANSDRTAEVEDFLSFRLLCRETSDRKAQFEPVLQYFSHPFVR